MRCPDCTLLVRTKEQLDRHWSLRHSGGRGSSHWCDEHPIHATDVRNPAPLRRAIDAAKELRDLALAADILNDTPFPTARKEHAEYLVRYLEGLQR